MKAPDLRIYHSGAACSLASVIALEEAGCDYTMIDAFESNGKKPDFLKANPTGQVPCLLVDGQPLTETSAILLYLARQFPERKLLPLTGEPFADARIESDIIFCSAGVQPWVRQIVATRYFTNDPHHLDEVKALGRKKLNERMRVLDTKLGDKPWFYGEWSAIDGYIFWISMNAVIQSVDRSGIERCIDHAIRAVSRPAFLAAVRRAEASQPATLPDSRMGLSPRRALNRFCEAAGIPLLP